MAEMRSAPTTFPLPQNERRSDHDLRLRPPPPQPTVAVAGSNDRIPVRRIFCVGRNYAAHAREMGRDPDREPPFFFTKPADAVVMAGETVAYPPETENLHYEAELVAGELAPGGRDIAEADAPDHVWGYAPGNDLTRRDLQLAAREKGRPWDWGKAFDRSAVIGPVRPVGRCGPPVQGRHPPHAQRRGQAGGRPLGADLVGPRGDRDPFAVDDPAPRRPDHDRHTPAGVGPMVEGDSCTVSIEGFDDLTTTIGPRA